MDFALFEKEMSDLKTTLIYPRIFKEENETFAFDSWIHCLNEHSYEFDYLR